MNADNRRTLVIAAGGTGGHLFPAEALAQELNRRGWRIYLMTDERANKYGVTFPCEEIIEIPSATISPRAPLRALAGLAKIVSGFATAYSRLGQLRPDAVIGFGGYPTLPPLLAARARGIATCIHEANAVIGRANRMVIGRVNLIASTFPDPKRMPESARDRMRLTGNPVRDAVLAMRNVTFQAPFPDGDLRLLVFGGSQGARVFSDIVPSALASLDEDFRERIVVTQQCREEDIERVRSQYDAAGIIAEIETFFMDLPERMAASHLVVSRSGASTVCELGVIGRPGILVPLPHAVEGDQLHNAQAFEQVGGGWVIPQSDFTPAAFAEKIRNLMQDPDQLADAADGAKTFGRPDAAADLADLLETLGRDRISGREDIPERKNTATGPDPQEKPGSVSKEIEDKA